MWNCFAKSNGRMGSIELRCFQELLYESRVHFTIHMEEQCSFKFPWLTLEMTLNILTFRSQCSCTIKLFALIDRFPKNRSRLTVSINCRSSTEMTLWFLLEWCSSDVSFVLDVGTWRRRVSNSTAVNDSQSELVAVARVATVCGLRLSINSIISVDALNQSHATAACGFAEVCGFSLRSLARRTEQVHGGFAGAIPLT